MTEIRGYNKTKRVYPLTTWDVSFNINADILNRFLDFLEDIHPDLPLIFYKDKILIRQKSSDNISFVTIYIDIIDVMNYDPGLEDIGIDHKLAIIDATGLAGEISGFAKGADMVTVRIDTKRLKKCEFTCGEYRRHKVLLTVPDYFPKLEITERTIKKNRENYAAKGCNMIVEPETFTKICAIGGKKGGSDMMFEVSKQGLLIYTSDEDSESGSSFEILNESDGSHKDMGSMIGVVDNIDYSDEDDSESYDTGNDYNDDVDNIDDKGIDDIKTETDIVSADSNVNTNNDIITDTGISEIDDAWNMPIQYTDKDRNVSNKGNKKKDKNKDKEQEREKEREKKMNANTNMARSKFLLFDMSPSVDSINVGQKKDLISVMTKLKAQNPILIEIRYNSPLILEQTNSGLWRTTLTIASVLPEDSS